VHLTGWAYHPGAFNIYKDCDLVLPISDHADFDELVRTATESGATKVYTVHGMPGFAQHLRSLGIDAEHLAEHPNTATDGSAACEEPEAAERPSDERGAADRPAPERRGPTGRAAKESAPSAQLGLDL
jgi:DNA ligase-1